MPSHAIILNAASGPAACTPAALAPLLAAHNLSAQIHCPNHPSEIPALTRSLLDQGFSTIIAAGGDGTISSIASVLVHHPSATLALIPLGTFNHLAKDLNIPLDLNEALALIASPNPHTTAIDTATVNDRLFLNNLSLGVYPAFVTLRGNTRRHPRPIRWLLNARAMARAFHHLPRLFVHIELNNHSLRRITPLIFVGNNTYRIEEPNSGTRATLTDAHLSLVISRPKGPWGLARVALRAALGTLRGPRDLEITTTPNLTIHSPRHELPIAIDGEVMRLKTPLRCACRPHSLRIITPAPTSAPTPP